MNKELAAKITDIMVRHCEEINRDIGQLTDEKVTMSVTLGINDIHHRTDGRPDTNMYYSFFGNRVDGCGPRLIDKHSFYSEEKDGR